MSRPNRPQLVFATLACLLFAGCAHRAPRVSTAQDAIAAAARPLLTLNPDADWTASFNTLVEAGPDALDWLLESPRMQQIAAPDDLLTLTHNSLAHLLMHPSQRPRISATVFAVTLDVLHFDPRVQQAPLGPICMPDPRPPARWHDLFPADFDHERAARINIEADRLALQDSRRDAGRRPLTTTVRLRPEPRLLRPLLARRCADRWEYSPTTPRVVLVSDAFPGGSALITARSHDYNLIRAACIQLGVRAGSGPPLDDLLRLAGHDSPIVAYNARFALRYSPNPRVRELARHVTGGN